MAARVCRSARQRLYARPDAGRAGRDHTWPDGSLARPSGRCAPAPTRSNRGAGPVRRRDLRAANPDVLVIPSAARIRFLPTSSLSTVTVSEKPLTQRGAEERLAEGRGGRARRGG